MPELLQSPPSTTAVQQNGAPKLAIEPDDHLNRLLAAEEEPWYKSFGRNIHDLFHKEELPPLEVTSKPVAVKDIWGMYRPDKKSNWMSIGIHSAVAILLLTVASSKTVQDQVRRLTPLVDPNLAPFIPQVKPKQNVMQGGGGGGDRSPAPASKGKLPRISNKQFVPPTAVIKNEHPKLVMEPTIVAPPDSLPQVTMPNFGDPLAKIGPPSNGPGSGGGIGSGDRGGVGSGKGAGYGPGEGGGVGGGTYKVGGGVSAPAVIYQEQPEYSEEARKAKFSGTVVLRCVVDPNGRARDIHVVRSLGLGLDEKAIEALGRWKFKPGMKNGTPVPVYAVIEVNFRLL